jgi:hypothetical protein
MQARENGSGDLMALKYVVLFIFFFFVVLEVDPGFFSRMQRLMYPKTSAYRSETGGLMPALRELTVEQSV